MLAAMDSLLFRAHLYPIPFSSALLRATPSLALRRRRGASTASRALVPRRALVFDPAGSSGQPAVMTDPALRVFTRLSMARLTWNDELDRALINGFLAEHREGNKLQGIWIHDAVSRVSQRVTALAGYGVGNDQIRRRLIRLKCNFRECFKHFDMLRGLYHIPGFTWNPSTELIEAESQRWDELGGYAPDALRWRTKRIPNYNKLHEIFAEDMFVIYM